MEKFMNNGRALELLDFRRYTDATYYSNPEFNGVLGQAERIIVHLVVSDASNSPTVTITAQDSSDNENWADVGSALVTASSISTANVYRGSADVPHARYYRLKVVVSGGGTVSVTMTVRASIKAA